MSFGDCYVATNGSDSGGGAWSSAYTNIQEAIDASGNSETIYVAGHTFFLTNQISVINFNDLTIKGGYAAANDSPLPGTRDLDLYPTVFCSANTNTRIMYIQYITNSVLDGVRIIDGNVYPDRVYGGGIYIRDTESLLIANCMLKDNQARFRGGALYARVTHEK
jgi:hypothetical protein